MLRETLEGVETGLWVTGIHAPNTAHNFKVLVQTVKSKTGVSQSVV